MKTEIADYFLRYPEIVNAEICPYCSKKPVFLNNSEILYNGRNFGPVYYCSDCSAWVGCHKGTETPLGRLADGALRSKKISAHGYFDGLWKAKIKLGYTKEDARSKAYKWLSKKMNKIEKYCHIGMFTIKECEKVIEICKPYYK